MTTPRKPAATKMTVTKTTVPAGAKMPADRKPKDDGQSSIIWKGKTWTINDEAFDDMDFLEAAENSLYVRCGQLLLGAEQYQVFKEHMRDPKTGRAKASELVKFVEAISEQFQAKNS